MENGITHDESKVIGKFIEETEKLKRKPVSLFNTSEINRILGIHRTSARRKEHEEIWAYLDKEEKTIRAYSNSSEAS